MKRKTSLSSGEVSTDGPGSAGGPSKKSKKSGYSVLSAEEQEKLRKVSTRLRVEAEKLPVNQGKRCLQVIPKSRSCVEFHPRFAAKSKLVQSILDNDTVIVSQKPRLVVRTVLIS